MRDFGKNENKNIRFSANFNGLFSQGSVCTGLKFLASPKFKIILFVIGSGQWITHHVGTYN
jgi:hypothetical protein